MDDLDVSNLAGNGEEGTEDDKSVFNDLISQDKSTTDGESTDDEQDIREFVAEMLFFEVIDESETSIKILYGKIVIISLTKFCTFLICVRI